MNTKKPEIQARNAEIFQLHKVEGVGPVELGKKFGLNYKTIEAIIRRKIPYMIRFGINLASWMLILSLILFLSFQDIRRAIFGR